MVDLLNIKQQYISLFSYVVSRITLGKSKWLWMVPSFQFVFKFARNKTKPTR